MAGATTSVFVGNLSWKTKEFELNNFMAAAGEVVSVSIQHHADTMRSKGWGLVEYKTVEEAQNAITTLNGQVLDSRTLHIRLDRSSVECNGLFSVFVGNLPWNKTDENLTSLFAEFEPVCAYVRTTGSGRSRGFGVIHFVDETTGKAAIEAMEGYEIDGRRLNVREDRTTLALPRVLSRKSNVRTKPKKGSAYSAKAETAPLVKTDAPNEYSCSVYVSNLSWNVTDDDLMKHFSEIAGLVKATVKTHMERSRGWGIVEFETHEQANEAISRISGTTLDNRQVKVRLDKK